MATFHFHSIVGLLVFVAVTSVFICDGASLQFVQEDQDYDDRLNLKEYLQSLVDDQHEVEEDGLLLLFRDFVQLMDPKCQKNKDSYSCCDEGKGHSGCVKIRFIEKPPSIDLTLVFDGKVLLHTIVKENNPSPFCVDVPSMSSAKACVTLKNLKLQAKGASGCVELTAKYHGITVKTVQLGCFNLASTQLQQAGRGHQVKDDDVVDITEPLTKAFHQFLADNQPGEEEVGLLIEDFVQLMDPKCQNNKDSFSCCDEGKGHSGCVKIKFIEKPPSIDLTLAFDDKVLLHTIVKENNPSPFCVDVPSMSSAKACVTLKNLKLQAKGASGCVELTAKYHGITVKTVQLGCFNLASTQLQQAGRGHQVEDDDVVDITEPLTKAFHQFLPDNQPGQEEVGLLIEDFVQLMDPKCQKQKASYSCCDEVKGHSGCVKIKFIEKPPSIDLTLVFDGKVLLHEIVKENNPSPFCVDVPSMSSAKACVTLKNLKLQVKGASGCVELKAMYHGFTVKTVQLGCFNLASTQLQQAGRGHQVKDDDVVDITQPLTKAFHQFLVDNQPGEEEVGLLIEDFVQLMDPKCQKQKASYSCCDEVKGHSGCVKIRFIEKPPSIDLTLVFDGKVLLHTIVKENNPSPFCVDVPSMSSAKACVTLKNLKLQAKGASGCVELTAKYHGITVKTVQLGCFNLASTQLQQAGRGHQVKDDDVVDITQPLTKAFHQFLPDNQPGEEEVGLLIEDLDELMKGRCERGVASDKCCVTFRIRSDKHSVCIKMAFIQKAVGVNIALLFDGKVMINQTVREKDPPPFCVHVPDKTSAKICLTLKDFKVLTNSVAGCLQIQVQSHDGMYVKNFELRCFKFPPTGLQQAGQVRRIADDADRPTGLQLLAGQIRRIADDATDGLQQAGQVRRIAEEDTDGFQQAGQLHMVEEEVIIGIPEAGVHLGAKDDNVSKEDFVFYLDWTS